MTGVNGDARLRLQSGESSSSLVIPYRTVNQSNVPQLQMDQIQQNFVWFESNGKRAGFPPISPYAQTPTSRSVDQHVGSQNFRKFSSHFSAVDELQPLIPSQYPDSSASAFPNAVSMEVREGAVNSASPLSHRSLLRSAEGLPPQKAHRRSSSDIPGGLDRVSVRNSSESLPVQMIKVEFSLEKDVDTRSSKVNPERESMENLFTAYMNWDNMDAPNSSGIDDKYEYHEDQGSRDSASKTNDSNDNEATSSVNESGGSLPFKGLPTLPGKLEGLKRNANGNAAIPTQHTRGASMDSFMREELPETCLSPMVQPGSLSRAKSVEGNESAVKLGFGSGEFNGAELQKIMANEKLAEMACSDPKRVKRILANRQSAARSKERKTRYTAELEHKIQSLQVEASTLAAQLTLLRNDSAGLTNQNNELKFRLQAMEQQARLRDSLNEALRAEVEHLKLVITESNRDASKLQQHSLNPRIYQLHQQQQCTQLHIHQLQQSNTRLIKNESEQ